MNFIRWALLAVFSISVLSFPTSYRRWTHTFYPTRMVLEFPQNRDWEVSLNEEDREEIKRILSQPFNYVGKGLQSFAFASQDDQYVIKFFRFDSCKVPFGQMLVHFCKEKLDLHPRERLPLHVRMEKNLQAAYNAYRYLREETGVIYANLNPKPKEWPLVQVCDRMGRWHSIDTGTTRFVLQKKGKLLRAALLEAQAENPAKVERMVRSYAALLNSIESKGFYNLDPKMASNYGFIDEKAIQIDYGSLGSEPKAAPYHQAHYLERLRGFLGKKIPESLPTIDSELEALR